MSRLSKISFAAVAFTLVAAGCNERAPRSFVQPNVLKKSDLMGVNGDAKWYYIQTVTDAPVTSSVMFIGNSSELMKIRFDAQEGTLFARRAYEQIEGSEDRYQQDPAKYAGQPVAAWPITSHFDIIRDYNATTGEETNRIIESTERAWNEREFFRVDWSNNVLTPNDVIGIGINFLFEDGISVQPGSYWESDPTKPDAFHMERATAEEAALDGAEFDAGEANYLDVTNKWVLNPTPKTIEYEEGGVKNSITYPSCFFAYQLDDCASQIIKVRHAFAKISPKHDYEPRNWDGKQMDLFGIWDVGLNRLTYNRQYGVTNTGFKRHAARFNLWKKSYEDPAHKVKIPYASRTQRTIPYYMSSSLEPFPPDLFDTAKEVVKQWNDAAKVAVQDVTGKTAVEDVFVTCHNPVKLVDDSMGAKDPAVCSEGLKPELDAKGEIKMDANEQPILRARQGDPRRSHIFWVNQQQNGGPLGYGPPLFDIETGETISGQAYIYGGAIDSYSARSRDLIMLLLGRRSADEFITGVNVKEWVGANRAGVRDRSQLHTQDEIAEKVKAMDFSWARGQAPEAPLDTSGDLRKFLTSLKNREAAIYNGGIFGQSNANIAELKRTRLRGTPLEGMMVNADIMAQSGAKPGTDFTALGASEKARISPIRSEAVRRAINDRMDKMRAFGYDFADFADEGMAQRALTLANDPAIPNMDEEAIRQKVRKEIFLGVTLHEMGHNVGMRHNFRGSYDSMNYFPQYWQLRDAAAKNPSAQRFMGIDPNTQMPIGKAYAGADCNTAARKGKLRPRYIDCPGGATSVQEAQGMVREWQYSSIMDYGAEFNSDFAGLGRYDKAAMKFSYAGDGYVEVFTDAKTDQTSQLKWAALSAFQGAFGFPSAIGLTSTLESINYTTYPTLFNSGIEGISKRKDVPYSQICTEDCEVSGYLRADSDGNPLVPYYFCSDEFAGNLTCMRFDSGADAYEQATDVISRYENFYLLNNFKRDKYAFHAGLGYRDRVASRYFNILRTQMTWYTLLRSDFVDYFGTDDTFYFDENGWGNFSIAVAEGFDLLGRVLTKPQAGSYKFVSKAESTDYPVAYYKQNGDSTEPGLNGVAIGLLDGKYIDTTWDFDACGYYWSDECQSRIGYFIDKTVALDILSQSQAYFTGRDTNTDVRRYAIGYILPYKKQVEEKMGALLAGDLASWAPRLDLSTPAGQASKVTVKPWSLNEAPTDGATAQNIVDPAGGFTLQLYAGVYGLSEFPSTFDRSFVDKTRIFVLGNGEAPVSDSTISAGCANGSNGWLCVSDAETGKTYAAKLSPLVQDRPAGPSYRADVGARMLETYRAILADAAAAPTNPAKQLAVVKYRQNLDIMRSLHNAYGYAAYKTDAPFYY
jgi:hypothetical protein